MQKFACGNNNAFSCIKGKDGLNDFGGKLPTCVKAILLFDGKVKVWVDNRTAELAEAGDVIILFPNQKYRFETQINENFIAITADIKRLSELLGVLSSYIPTHSVIKGVANDGEICALAESAIKACSENNNDYQNTVLKGYVTALLGKLFAMMELRRSRPSVDEKPATINEIIGYCNLHFRENLSLTVLEEELHISRYYISHVINEKLGESFNDYLNEMRINEACRLLIESDKSIKTISAEIGFGTIRSFDRAFKAKKGETAREYRKRNTENSKKE